jgi:phosphatidylglycerophosphate synthase
VGSIIDPAADKTLMTVMTITLAMEGVLPRKSFYVQKPSHFYLEKLY